MLGISDLKYHELVPVVVNKHLHRMQDRFEQTPNGSHIENSTRHTQDYFEAKPIF